MIIDSLFLNLIAGRMDEFKIGILGFYLLTLWILPLQIYTLKINFVFAVCVLIHFTISYTRLSLLQLSIRL